MNQDLLNNPFDEELQSMTGPFGTLLRAVVDDIDRHGLKRRHLEKHERAVDGFFDDLAGRSFRSEAAEALRAQAAEVPGQAVHVPPARRRALEQQQRRERDQAVRLLPGGHRRAA